MWLKSNFQDHSDAKKVTRKATDAPGRKPSSKKSRATTIFKAVSNSQRLKILSHLIEGEKRSVKELETVVKSLSQSSLTQHLWRLWQAKIIDTPIGIGPVLCKVNVED